MKYLRKWLNLQLFGDGAGGDSGEGAAAPGETAAPAAGEQRLRELGVPESVLAKRAKRSTRPDAQPAQKAQEATTDTEQKQDAAAETTTPEGSKAEEAPARMSWDEIMADPEYNQRMQQTIQARLRSAKGAEESLSRLQPAIELLARKYGMDPQNLDAEALTKAISDDDAFYEDKALEMGVSVETAKKIDQSERENRRMKEEQARTIEQQKIASHLAKLQQQGEAMKATFPQFDLNAELKNPAFVRMTSPNVGISVEDAYYAVHRKEIQTAAMQVTAKQTAQQLANSIRSGQSRPVENGTSTQAPSVTTFDYAHASKDQREALKKQIREAAAQGRKIYPGQR